MKFNIFVEYIERLEKQKLFISFQLLLTHLYDMETQKSSTICFSTRCYAAVLSKKNTVLAQFNVLLSAQRFPHKSIGFVVTHGT